MVPLVVPDLASSLNDVMTLKMLQTTTHYCHARITSLHDISNRDTKDVSDANKYLGEAKAT